MADLVFAGAGNGVPDTGDRVTECQNCHNDGNVTYLTVHTGGTQGPTCTTGKICEKCGAKYDIHSHVWGEWTPNGNGTHTRRCTNPNCNAVENASCGGDSSATCISPGTCTTCGGRYDGDHKWTNRKLYRRHSNLHHQSGL